jgi:hypothetical protein
MGVGCGKHGDDVLIWGTLLHSIEDITCECHPN